MAKSIVDILLGRHKEAHPKSAPPMPTKYEKPEFYGNLPTMEDEEVIFSKKLARRIDSELKDRPESNENRMNRFFKGLNNG
jgi:hypothetical protein